MRLGLILAGTAALSAGVAFLLWDPTPERHRDDEEVQPGNRHAAERDPQPTDPTDTATATPAGTRKTEAGAAPSRNRQRLSVTVAGRTVVTMDAGVMQWVRADVKTQLAQLAATHQVIVVADGCTSDAEEKVATDFFDAHFPDAVAGQDLQLHLICCEHASSITHIVRRLEPQCHVDSSGECVQQLQKHLKALVLTTNTSTDLGMHRNVLHVESFIADHVVAALTV